MATKLKETSALENIPAIYAKSGDEHVSEKYSFISTEKIVTILNNNGWKISGAIQRNPYRRNPQFAKHLIRFRKNDQNMNTEYFPEVVLVNSHDRSCRFTFYMGIFRLVCSNGLIIKTSSFGEFSLMHMGFDQKEVVQITKKVVTNAEALFPKIEKMKKIILTEKMKSEFAKKAAQLHWKQHFSEDFNYKILLSVRRDVDKKDDLWTVYNVVQENIMKGGLHDKLTSNRTMREIRNIDKTINVNNALWNLAMSRI